MMAISLADFYFLVRLFPNPSRVDRNNSTTLEPRGQQHQLQQSPGRLLLLRPGRGRYRDLFGIRVRLSARSAPFN